ncbi:ribosome maturation factor RimP [Gordonia effusa NBRC 100432]|uniref:Ribosome maturation factor RimP n=1 Tax=Gordonia effusa NBRC 100432 TaxID=1077974 RepID=H0R230_9ACTN|nr:ribosome maturation factor RimP [Gordonia effusa]GAB19135.1 ribosome maturation factor RimP [Gordonia effusa NBRC 100432]
MSTAPMPPQQIHELVAPRIAADGYDVEDLATKPSPDGGIAITIVVDRDGGAELDALAKLTRDLVEMIDSAVPDADYTLELTTPGINRPLTEPRHWRRAQGRKVDVDVSEGGKTERISGRIGRSADGVVDLIRNERGRFTTTTIDLKSVTKAVVQVDFSAPNATELELCGLDDAAIARLTRKN